MFSIPSLSSLIPLYLTFFIVIGESLAAAIIHVMNKLLCKLASKDNSLESESTSDSYLEYGTWKHCLFFFGTLAIIISTAIWALQMDDMEPRLNAIIKYHTICFPVMYGTALFYLLQPAGRTYSFFKIPMRYIYLGYVLLEVLAIEFLEFEYLPFILSGIYLVLAVASLIQRFLKKSKGYTPSGHPQNGQPV